MEKEQLIKEFSWLLQPLARAASSKENLEDFLKHFGHQVSQPDLGAMFPEFEVLGTAIDNLIEQAENGEIEVAEVLTEITRFFLSIQALADNTAVKNYFVSSFFPEVFDYLVLQYLSVHKPEVVSVMEALGVLDIQIENRDIDYKKIVLDFEKVSTFVTDNKKWLKEVYGWKGNPSLPKEKRLDYEQILNVLELVLESYGLSLVYVKELTAAQLQGFLKNIPGGEKFFGASLPLIQEEVSSVDENGEPVFAVEAGIKLLPFGDISSPSSLGIAITPYAKGNLNENIEISENLGLKVDISGDADADAEVYLAITPDGISSKGGTADVSGGFQMLLTYAKPSDENLEIFDIQGLAKLMAKKLTAGVGGDLKGNAHLSAGVKDLEFSIDLSEDGLLGNFLSDPIILFIGDMGVKWQYGKGISFEGGNNLAIQVPLHIDLSVMEINAFGIELGLEDNTSLITTLSGNLNLGVIKASIDSIGSRINIIKSDNGVLGKNDFQFDFQPPKGVGLSIDAGVVKGGGFVKFYPEKGEYSGFLELTFSEIISLKAIGIINTKMPDGSEGFSLLVIISAEFGSGIQLGFGFTLLGVGGLLGLNRTMKLDALATGVRTGAVNGIMFPTNIIENAPRIISDLQDFFPVQQDRFLIGPMAKLGWGTPTLISISLGIIIEIPGNIAILGILKIVLPTEEASLIKLQVNFIGAIEFDKERLWFFASMYDSRVLFYTLEGEMGMLVGWGAKANFVSSVGGFHPAFKPPTLPFPNPVRISLSILNESWGKIRVMAYFAVTSNTAQFGAKAELYFGFSELKIEGHIGFDALFQFSPFYMIIQLSASLSVKVFGIGLFSVRVKMSLEGPAPWYAHGTGSISLLFFDIDVDFDFTWGEEKDTRLPPISIMPLLIEEFEKQENWKALVPVNNNLLVSLRKIDSVAELVLHPVGTLQVIQRAIPLELTLDKMGSQKPDDANFFSVDPEGSELSKIKTLDEDFAIAQFKELKDAEKLSSPSFQPIQGGMELSISGEQLKTGKTVKRHVRYELITVDTNYKRGRKAFFKFLKSLFGVFLRGNTVSRADISYQTNRNLQPFDSKINIQEPGFSVAKISNNTVFDAEAHFSSQAQAKEYMQAQLLVHPELEDELHVLPNNEINPAA
ncbi:hypothetical protein SAMN05660776_0936 [Salegentibacter holothuriorum]|uniref:DUF6603 domain-containing protein n=1 Tax=Salegentibacter holothuriorum TaxID=241145 RepID=A0A1T5AXM3_9FLAO|nr:DUF6603 domain-containing protein [Salegentibacter holothuriorum]SKB39527.1 hypothetical protein SAMN05660776_0936 [Salegentibacter holothuriorum]